MLVEVSGEVALLWDYAQWQQRRHKQSFGSHVDGKKELQTSAFHGRTVENMTAPNQALDFYSSPRQTGMEGVFFAVWSSKRLNK